MRRAHFSRSAAIAILFSCCGNVSALTPSLQISQYAHKAWTLREGFFRNVAYSIAQTPDGYLWLGTDSGLLRFDGVRTVKWEPPAGGSLPSGFIRSLLAARDGTLWIGADGGLVSWKDGRLTGYPQFTENNTRAMIQDRTGTVWVSQGIATKTKLCAIRDAKTQCYGEDGSLGIILDLHEDRGGSLWVATRRGMLRWKPAPPTFFPGREIDRLIEDVNGTLIGAGAFGIAWFSNGKEVAPPALPPAITHLAVRRFLRDRDGGLWLGTEHSGLVHLHGDRVDAYTVADGLSSNSVRNLFEDREGNIWVTTDGGIDRFRDFAVIGISDQQGLSDSGAASLLADRQGNIWIGAARGLNRWRAGEITKIRVTPGPRYDVYPRFQDKEGHLWVSTYPGNGWLDNGRFHLVEKKPLGGAMAKDNAGAIWSTHSDALARIEGDQVHEITWSTLGRNDFAVSLLPDPTRGGIWLGFYRGDLAFLKDGQLRTTYTRAQGLGTGRVEQLQFDRDGAIWAATQGGLSRIKDSRIVTLTARNGLPCDSVHWMMKDDYGSAWIYTACGLVRRRRAIWMHALPIRGEKFRPRSSTSPTASEASPWDIYTPPRLQRRMMERLWFVTRGWRQRHRSAASALQ